MILQNKTDESFADPHMERREGRMTLVIGMLTKKSNKERFKKIEGLSNFCSSVVFEDRACVKVYELISKYTPNGQLFCILQKKNKGRMDRPWKIRTYSHICVLHCYSSAQPSLVQPPSFPGYSIATITTATIIAATAT